MERRAKFSRSKNQLEKVPINWSSKPGTDTWRSIRQSCRLEVITLRFFSSGEGWDTCWFFFQVFYKNKTVWIRFGTDFTEFLINIFNTFHFPGHVHFVVCLLVSTYLFLLGSSPAQQHNVFLLILELTHYGSRKSEINICTRISVPFFIVLRVFGRKLKLTWTRHATFGWFLRPIFTCKDNDKTDRNVKSIY